MPSFDLDNFVLAVPIRRPGLTPKLTTTRTGSSRVIGTDRDYLHQVQNNIIEGVRTVNAARLHFYSDSQLNVIANTEDVFQNGWSHIEYGMASIANVAVSEDSAVIGLAWVGFGPHKRT